MTRPARQPGGRWIYLIIFGLLLGMLLAVLDNVIVGTAAPHLVADIGGLAELPWVTTGYSLAITASAPLWGKLGDLYGHKRAYLVCVLWFMAGSALCGSAVGMPELITFRVVQGVGAGGLVVNVLAATGVLVSPRERGRYVGTVSAVLPVGVLCGPLVGGLITDTWGWRWAFYVNLPLGLVSLAIVGWLLHLPKPDRRPRIDYAGAATLTVAISAIVLFTSWGGNRYPWSSAPVLGLLAVSVFGLVLFVLIEARAVEPLLPLTLFSSRNFTLVCWLGLVYGLSSFTSTAYLPLFQQVVQHASAANSALLLFPVVGGAFLTSMIAGRLISRTGRYRGAVVLGSALTAAGLLLMSLLTENTARTLAIGFMVVLGVGQGLLMNTTMLVTQNSANRFDQGAASSSQAFFRQLGGSVGLALLGSLFTWRLASRLNAALGASQARDIMVGRGLGQGLSSADSAIYASGVVSAYHLMYVVAGAIVATGIGAAWLISEVPLRGSDPAPVGSAVVRPGGSQS